MRESMEVHTRKISEALMALESMIDGNDVGVAMSWMDENNFDDYAKFTGPELDEIDSARRIRECMHLAVMEFVDVQTRAIYANAKQYIFPGGKWLMDCTED